MHIHLGCDGGLELEDTLEFIKYFDQYVVLPSILVDTDSRRRSLYGKAGCFRRTPYGAEARCLSSFMMSNDLLLSQVWDNTMKAIYHFNHNTPLVDSGVIQDVINNNRADVAQEIIKTLH